MDAHRMMMDGRTVTLYPADADDAPLVCCSMYAEAGEAVLDACSRMGCPRFHLLSVAGLRWESDLSPWPHEPMVSKDDDFTGGAEGYMRLLEGEAVPWAEGIVGDPVRRVIAGYSMAGLFALYAPHISDAFDSCVSASGSVWYPGFADYVRDNDFVRRPDRVYLSVGDRESRTRNAFMRAVEDCDRALLDIYLSKGVDAVFETNPGNHFRDADVRLAKGISWVLSRL